MSETSSIQSAPPVLNLDPAKSGPETMTPSDTSRLDLAQTAFDDVRANADEQPPRSLESLLSGIEPRPGSQAVPLASATSPSPEAGAEGSSPAPSDPAPLTSEQINRQVAAAMSDDQGSQISENERRAQLNILRAEQQLRMQRNSAQLDAEITAMHAEWGVSPSLEGMSAEDQLTGSGAPPDNELRLHAEAGQTVPLSGPSNIDPTQFDISPISTLMADMPIMEALAVVLDDANISMTNVDGASGSISLGGQDYNVNQITGSLEEGFKLYVSDPDGGQGATKKAVIEVSPDDDVLVRSMATTTQGFFMRELAQNTADQLHARC